jgi:hypothetical protein
MKLQSSHSLLRTPPACYTFLTQPEINANHLRELPLVRGGGWLFRYPTPSNELKTSPPDSYLPTNARSVAIT